MSPAGGGWERSRWRRPGARAGTGPDAPATGGDPAAGGPFAFVAPDEIGDRPHLMIDGAARFATAATLSHWPGSPTPVPLLADLSTESALLALAQPRALPSGVTAVTVDHADEDGTVAVAVLCTDGLAEAHGGFLTEVARVGDFGVVQDRNAALVAFALAALLDPRRTPVRAVRSGEAVGLSATGLLVGHGARVIPALVADPDAAADLWAAEAAAYDASVAALADGSVRIVDDPGRDLAVVDAPAGCPDGAAWGGYPLHPAALHSATGCMRLAVVAPGDCQAWFRYETWVRLARPPRQLRVDLASVVAELDRRELAASRSGGGSWHFDGAGALRPRLRYRGERPSAVPGDEFLSVLRSELDRLAGGPPAWDPYR